MQKQYTVDEVKAKLLTNDKWLYRGLLRIYSFQTLDEQRVKHTKYHNGMGFNGTDGTILSSFAQFLKRTGFLTAKQKKLARKKMQKYAGQLVRYINHPEQFEVV